MWNQVWSVTWIDRVVIDPGTVMLAYSQLSRAVKMDEAANIRSCSYSELSSDKETKLEAIDRAVVEYVVQHLNLSGRILWTSTRADGRRYIQLLVSPRTTPIFQIDEDSFVELTSDEILATLKATDPGIIAGA